MEVVTRIVEHEISIDTTGSAGVAVGTGDKSFVGKILAVDMIPHASAPATQDVTVFITQNDNNTLDLATVATFTDTSSTPARRVPKVLATQHDGTALANLDANGYDHFVTGHGVHVEIAQSDALTGAAKIIVTVEE